MNLKDIEGLSDAEKLALVKSIQESVAVNKAKQVSLEAGQYAKLVVDAVKKIKTDLEARYSEIKADIDSKAAKLKDGKDGLQGPKGEKGDRGFDGINGKDGRDGKDGKDGVDGSDGLGVADAHIDFDGALVITLTNGNEINAGEVVPFDVAEKIKVIGNGGGTSQYVLDAISDLQTQIAAISPTLVVTDTFVVSSQSAMLALSTAEKGDIAVRTDLNKTFILKQDPYSTLANWQELLTPTDAVQSVNGKTGTVVLSTTDIGEGTSLYYTDARARAAVSAGTGISYSSATGVITNSSPDQTVVLTGGTGITTSGTYPNFTITNSSPDRTVAITGSGTTSVTGTYPNFTVSSADQYTGTVTSVGGTGTVSGLTLTGTVTSTGNLTLGGTLAVTPSNFASQTANTVLAAPNGVAGTPTFRALVAADIPTLNQNTTGTASNVTGVVAIANGGTGASTRQDAMDALAGAVTSGQYLRGNGTDVVMSAIQAGDVPTLNQNTTGSSGSLVTTGFSITESGGKLLIKYGATTIASISSTGIITSATNIVSNGTP